MMQGTEEATQNLNKMVGLRKVTDLNTFQTATRLQILLKANVRRRNGRETEGTYFSTPVQEDLLYLKGFGPRVYFDQ